MEWQYFILGLIVYQLLKMLALATHHQIVEYRQKKFLKLVSITFPDKEQITFIALDTSDKRSMARLERELREEYDLPETKSERSCR